MLVLPWPQALEKYSEQHPQEVLQIDVETEGEKDTVLIFRGFSSSLVRATPADLNEPVIRPGTRLVRLDRLRSPLNPIAPEIIEADLPIPELIQRLQAEGIDPEGLECD
jgi:hypothetical protein